jgi:carboxyl-terminal processing protease
VLDAAVGVVSLFIKDGKIVYTLGRKKSGNYTWNASGKAPFYDLPLIVMVNHGSASASEIVAGALQDHDRALIVGQTSFGKGLVMNPIKLTAPDVSNNAKSISLGTLMLSVSRYYTPSGRLIQRPYTGNREEYIKEGFDDIDLNAADSSKTGRPVFHTDLGRDVYGGGGITPDITLPPLERLNTLERVLRNSNICFEFGYEYLLRHSDVPQDFNTFLPGYRIPSDELEKFRAFVKTKGVNLDSLSTFGNELQKLFTKYDIPDDAFQKVQKELTQTKLNPDSNIFEHSLPFIERELKQEIARMVWGPEQRYRVWHEDDTELIAAVSHFEQAKQLLASRLALKKE